MTWGHLTCTCQFFPHHTTPAFFLLNFTCMSSSTAPVRETFQDRGEGTLCTCQFQPSFMHPNFHLHIMCMTSTEAGKVAVKFLDRAGGPIGTCQFHQYVKHIFNCISNIVSLAYHVHDSHCSCESVSQIPGQSPRDHIRQIWFPTFQVHFLQLHGSLVGKYNAHQPHKDCMVRNCD